CTRAIDFPGLLPDIVLMNKETHAAMPHVEIYTRAFCGYCARALALLRDKGVEFVEYDGTMGGPVRAEMIRRADGGATFPQIFIYGAHVGGCDDLMALEAGGKLDALLKR